MKRFLKNTLFLTLFCLGFLGMQDFCRKQLQGFTLPKARSSHPVKGSLNLSSEELPSIQNILNQPFFFLQRGLQCYVFVSQDQKYILKLLKWKELEAPLWTCLVPPQWSSSLRLRKEKKKDHDFTSYQIAFEELKEETGLIYLHLNKTQGLNVSLCLYDPIQVRHLIPADEMEFIIQKKVDPFLPYFEKYKEDEKKMTSFFSDFAEILEQRMKKNISDSDISLEYNMGVWNDHPILFDMGNLTYMDEIPDSLYEARLVLNWLRSNRPHLADFLEHKLNKLSTKETSSMEPL